MTTPANRLLTLIMLLQRQPNQKAADLAEELDVSVRTVHRYFSMLEEMGIPLYSERGPHGGFSLVRGYKLPPLIFTPEEAAAIYLGASLVREMWGKLYQEPAQAAMAKLDNVLPDEQLQEVNWARRSLAATGMHRADQQRLAPVLEKTRRAVREHRMLDMQYHSSNSPQAVQRQIEPYALIYRWGWWYVVAFCQLRQAVRSFRLDRIERLELTNQLFQVPADFNIQSYLEQDWQAPPHIQVRLRFMPQAAHIARYNYSMWESLDENPDGSIVVTFAAPNIDWAASTTLAFGPTVSVEQPEQLKSIVSEWAKAIYNIYRQFKENG